MALATWRLSHLVAQESIMAGLREVFGVIHDQDGIPVGWTNVVGQGVQCVACVSIWLAPVVLMVMALIPLAVVALALSTLAILLNAAVEALSG